MSVTIPDTAADVWAVAVLTPQVAQQIREQTAESGKVEVS